MKRPDRFVPSSEFGLITWLEATRVALPLKGVECRFDVTGTIGCVELDQIYHQNANQPLDCTYTFPLPAGAAVYRCELHVNGRVIRAKVEEQGAAKRIFREQKAAGRRAALVETERENLFTLSLGNVQPEDVIVVRFAWFQVLDRDAGALRLRVPTCPGVRYIPGEPLLRGSSGRGTVDDTDQVPDASRITPPRIDALHPDAAYFSIEGRLSSADVDGATVSSPSHAIFVREKDGRVTVALSGREEVPDRDFVLSWREPKAQQLAPQAWRWTESDAGRAVSDAGRAVTYALVQLRAPVNVQVAGGYAQDFYFLVDRSGSMEGVKWQRTCEALSAFVGLLGAEDRVWITLFESTFRDFAEAPMFAPEVLADRGFQRMKALGTAGGTELLPAAKHVIEKIGNFSKDRRSSVVLITDGQVGNEAAITSAFAKVPKVRVHTFGIDTAVNDAFLKKLARQQRGGCWLQTPDDDIEGTIAALGSRLQRPVITDLAVSGSWQPGAETWPDLHAEEIVTIALRGEAGKPLEISGRLPDGGEHRFAVQLDHAGSEAVKLLWAKERITALLEKGHDAEAIALAREHNLICKGAAFIAWDEAERVQIAKEEIVQPVMEESQSLYCSAPAACFHADSIDAIPRLRAKGNGRSILSDIGRGLSTFLGQPGANHESAQEREERERMAATAPKVREAFLRLGAPEQSIATWLADAQKGKANKASTFWVLLPAAEEMEKIRTDRETLRMGEKLEAGMVRALNGSLSKLADWYRQVNAADVMFASMSERLKEVRVPAPLMDCLFAWVCESGMPDLRRMKALRVQVESLDSQPFSGASIRTHWQAFLDKALGVGSEAHAEASRLLATMFDEAKRSAATR